MDRAWEEAGEAPYDAVPGDDCAAACGCVCLLGCGEADSEGGCCRKAASKEDRKKGRCEEGIFIYSLVGALDRPFIARCAVGRPGGGS